MSSNRNLEAILLTAGQSYEQLALGDNDRKRVLDLQRRKLAGYASRVLDKSYALILASPGHYKYAGEVDPLNLAVAPILDDGHFYPGILLSRATRSLELPQLKSQNPVFVSLADHVHRFVPSVGRTTTAIDLLNLPGPHVKSATYGSPSRAVARFTLSRAPGSSSDFADLVDIEGTSQQSEQDLGRVRNILRAIEATRTIPHLGAAAIMPELELPSVLYMPESESPISTWDQLSYDMSIPADVVLLQEITARNIS